ncbi:uncharacterized protein [Anabrus simplex]|uniref:uncharacterized protein isoform X1 n=1 Tax=Anabrus simplex TaxID=316456 RepID=UPI0035A27C12
MMLVGLLFSVVVVASSIQNYVGVSAATPTSPGDSESRQQLRLFNLTADFDIFPVTSRVPTPTSSSTPDQDEADSGSKMGSNVDELYQSSRLSDDILWDLTAVPKRRTNKILIDPWTTKVSPSQAPASTDDQLVSTQGSTSATGADVSYPLNTQQNISDVTNVTKVSMNLTTSTEYPQERQFPTATSVAESLNMSTDIPAVDSSTEPVDVTSRSQRATASITTTTVTSTTTDPSLNLEPPYFSRNPQPIYPHREDEIFHRIDFDPSNPYSHWDSDSEEQEREMELQRLQDDPEDKNITLQISASTSEEDKGPSPPPPLTGRSYLLLLAGNSTIVKLRQKDFAKYLKLNLAARLSLEYDDVRVNRVVLAPPQLLVNVSVVTPAEPVSENTAEEERLDESVLKEEAPLHMLAETNATLLELSGEEYHVVRLLPLRANPPTPESEEDEDDDAVESSTLLSEHHGDIELVIYTAIGGACAIVIFATLLITFGRYLRVLEIPWPWRRPKSFPSTWNLPNGRLRHHRMGDEHLTATSGPPPTVIYSGSFAARAAAAAAGASWVDDYQPQPNNILAEDPALGAKLMANNPMYADLEMGGNIMTKNTALYPDAETTSIISHHRPSPSKLHIFSCRPGSLLIPLPPHRVVRKNLAPPAPNNAPNNQKKPLETHPLDVRIGEDGQGHDNPNYQT